MGRDYAALPHEYYEEMADLTDEEWGRLTRALLVFSIFGEVVELTGNERFFYRRVMNRELRYQSAFQERSEKLSQAGKRGAKKRWGNGQAMEGDGRDGNTEADTDTYSKAKTKTKSKSNSLSSEDERREAGARERYDMEQLDRFLARCREEERETREGA